MSFIAVGIEVDGILYFLTFFEIGEKGEEDRNQQVGIKLRIEGDGSVKVKSKHSFQVGKDISDPLNPEKYPTDHYYKESEQRAWQFSDSIIYFEQKSPLQYQEQSVIGAPYDKAP